MFRQNAHLGVHEPPVREARIVPQAPILGGVIDPDITVEISGVVEGPGS